MHRYIKRQGRVRRVVEPSPLLFYEDTLPHVKKMLKKHQRMIWKARIKNFLDTVRRTIYGNN